MGDHGMPFTALVIIATLAFVVPILINRLRFLRIPVVVGELVAGIIIGRSGLNIVGSDPWLTLLSTLGITYLMFLSGVEIDFGLLSRLSRTAGGRRLFATTIAYFLIVLSLSVLAGISLDKAGLVEHPWIVALILTTCSVGVVVPTLKEKKLSQTEFGQAILVTALLLDFATMLFLAVLVTLVTGGEPSQLALITLLFGAVSLAYVGSERLRQKPFMKELAHATSQIGVRGAFMLIFLLAYLSELVGAEVILGAFLAGAVVSLVSQTDETSLRMKLDAIGFGFLVPIFFISVGAEFDGAALLSSSESVLLALAVIMVAYVAKVAPALLFAGRYGQKQALALGVLVTPGLSLAVAAAEIGFRLGLLTSSTHSALILLAIVTAAISPVVFEKLAPKIESAIKRRIFIVGANERALVLATRLSDIDAELTLVDRNPDRVTNAKERGFHAVQGDVLQKQTWSDLAPDTHTAVLISTVKETVNVKVAELLQHGFDVGSIVTQVNDSTLAGKLQAMGVRAITPAFSAISVMENIVRHPDLFAILNHEDDEVKIEEITVDSPELKNVMIKELSLPHDTLILAIRRGCDHVIPMGETRLKLGDVLTVVRSAEAMAYKWR